MAEIHNNAKASTLPIYLQSCMHATAATAALFPAHLLEYFPLNLPLYTVGQRGRDSNQKPALQIVDVLHSAAQYNMAPRLAEYTDLIFWEMMRCKTR